MALTRADTNMTNNNATFTVNVLGTCTSPYGNATSLSCPNGYAPNSTAGGNTITGATQFNTTCCVSTSG